MPKTITDVNGTILQGNHIAGYRPVHVTQSGVMMDVQMSNGNQHAVHIPTPLAEQRNLEAAATRATEQARVATQRAEAPRTTSSNATGSIRGSAAEAMQIQSGIAAGEVS
jgi:hypothetical protein